MWKEKEKMSSFREIWMNFSIDPKVEEISHFLWSWSICSAFRAINLRARKEAKLLPTPPSKLSFELLPIPAARIELCNSKMEEIMVIHPSTSLYFTGKETETQRFMVAELRPPLLEVGKALNHLAAQTWLLHCSLFRKEGYRNGSGFLSPPSFVCFEIIH